MVLLERCFCCSLAVAASVTGVYTLIAYVIAFTMEMCWIIQTEAKAPSSAYILCGGYFLIFVISGFLLRGLSVKKTLYLIGWLVAIGILSFPEAGLVLFLSIYYWKVRSFYGLTELTCWMCRVVVNVAGFICIHSLYSTWKEEKHAIRSRQGLQIEMSQRLSTLKGSVRLKNGLAYQNTGFSGSSIELNHAPNMPNLRRSASSVSSLLQTSALHSLHRGSHPHPFFTSPTPDILLLESEFKQATSEFNASNFDFVLASAMRHPKYIDTGLSQSRAQSMLDIRGSVSDLSPRKTMSVVDYPVRNPYTTQSLDRRLLRHERSRSLSSPDYFAAGDGRIRSAYFSPSPVRLELLEGRRRPYGYGRRGSTVLGNSKLSLGNESDDFQKYRDVAL